jgi:putative transposase
MWAVENRGRYNRDHLRYPSDVTAEEEVEVAALIAPARRGGRKRRVNIREVFNGLLYVLSTADATGFCGHKRKPPIEEAIKKFCNQLG